MALEITFEEDYKNSRGTNITNDSFTQNFKFYMCGNMIEEANVDPKFGSDDDLKAIEAAYTLIPPFRSVPLYDGTFLVLVLDNLDLNMLAYDLWEVSVTYTTPNLGGASGGGYQQDPGKVGPGVGENNSNNFVQLDFNVSASQEEMKVSREVLACQNHTGAPNATGPFTVGQPAPMGLTADGVEGSQTYMRQFDFGITSYFTPQRLTFAYVRRLYRMSTTLNSNKFFGFPPGSVIFLESEGSGDVFSVVPVSFTFKMRPNFVFNQSGTETLVDPTNDNINTMHDQYVDARFPSASPNSDPAFSGWSEIDYLFFDTADQQHVVQKPHVRTIHRKYGYSNFNRLEL